MKIWTLAATAALAFLIPAAAVQAGDDKPGKQHKGESARDESEKPAKGKKQSPDDLAQRVDALERRVGELAGLLKQQLAERDYTKPQPKLIAKAPQDHPEKQAHNEKLHNEKPQKEQPKSDQPMFKLAPVKLIKGPDGQLYIPLASLPPGLQVKYKQDAEARKQNEEKKPQKKPAKKNDD